MIALALTYLALLVAFYFSQRADARVSEEGFKQGYQEGNELAAKIFGKTPSELQLTAYNIAQLAVFSLPAIAMPFTDAGWIGVFAWLIAATLAAAGKGLMGVKKWRRVFASHGKSLDTGLTAWQKILGW